VPSISKPKDTSSFLSGRRLKAVASPAVSRGRITSLAYEAIKSRIIALEFPPGSKLEEQELTKKLGFGRTPIREALKTLVSDGLVSSHGPNAVYVKELTLKSVKDLWELLYHLGGVVFSLGRPETVTEDLVTRLRELHQKMDDAVNRQELFSFLILNAEFHKALASVANNSYLDRILEDIYCEEVRLSFFCFTQMSVSSEYWRKVQKEHWQLIESLSQHDFKQLQSLYSAHFATGIQRVANFIAGS